MLQWWSTMRKNPKIHWDRSVEEEHISKQCLSWETVLLISNTSKCIQVHYGVNCTYIPTMEIPKFDN